VNICKLNVSTNSGPESKVAPVTYIPPELPSDINELFQDAPHSGLNFDKYDEIPVKVTGKEIPSAIDTFEQAGILEPYAYSEVCDPHFTGRQRFDGLRSNRLRKNC